MNLNKRASKCIALALAGVAIFTPVLNSVSAMERTNDTVSIESEYMAIDSENMDTTINEATETMNNKAKIIQTVIQDDVDGISSCFGLTAEEKTKLIQDVIDKEMESENTHNRVKRGKLTMSVKVINKAWRKLPFNVRKTITQHTGVSGAAGLKAILSTVDHFTGVVEDDLKKSCKNMGMNNHYAYWTAKAITFVLF